ncbi:hypothetical protein EV141_0697 [Microcella putealis]|uniref:Alpha/beta hydrolase family protein n=1 Tax=Microcella putealis TaxID=337005 RepID=A0A4Q7LXP9_9MICO|nr:hypothetical protein [Microcella putealis]RZS59471.1 hypothetical protein EV141_0697 [Microcella putealis]TQM20096.1 hypothetical protein BJ957_2234 [Microcella putealis]
MSTLLIAPMGDAAAVSAGADDLARIAETLRALSVTLDQIADVGETAGDSVDAIRSRTVDATSGLRDAHERYEAAAGALTDYAVELADVQRRYDDAQADIDTAETEIRRLEYELGDIRRESMMLAVSLPDPAEVADRQQRIQWLGTQLSEARAVRDAALARARAAVDDWDDAATRAADRIRPALGTLNDSVLDRVGAALSDLGAFIAAVAQWVEDFLVTVLDGLILIAVAVTAIVVAVGFLLAAFPVYAVLLADGVLTLDEIAEQLVSVLLVAIPVLVPALWLMLAREANAPTPRVRPQQEYLGGRLETRGGRSDYGALFSRNGEVDRAGGAHSTVVEIVRVLDVDGSPAVDENGNPVWRVTLPSTQDWQIPGGDAGAVNDLGSNLALILTPDQRAAYERAVIEAMHQAGIGPNDAVMLAGWSQGGILAGALASDPTLPFDIRAIAVAGSPIHHMPIPSDVSVIALQHDGDHVPRLDGVPPRQDPDWVTVGVQSGTSHYPHGSEFYADSADRFTDPAITAEYPDLARVIDRQSLFFSELELAYRYEFAEAETAIP